MDIASSPVTASGGPTVYEILLGAFRFTAGRVPGEVTLIRAGDFDLTDDTVTEGLNVLDPLISEGTARISTLPSVQAIAEPGTVVLLSMGLLGSGWLRRKRPG